MDALTEKEREVLGLALRVLFDRELSYENITTIADLAEKFETKNAREIRTDLYFITKNPF